MTPFTLTPIGTSPAWYNPGEPSSGFLLEVAGQRILIDCGSGVISRYLAIYGPEAPIDAIVISHMHADHCFDLVPLKFGIAYGTLGHWRPQLWLPPDGRERLTRLASTWDDDFSCFTESYDVREYRAGTDFGIGGVQVAALEVPHYIRSHALRFEYAMSSFGYSSDLGPSDHLAPFMRGVDLLLAEAGFDERDNLDVAGRGHITAREAGELAQRAGAHSLLLTHVPIEHGVERVQQSASAAFRRGPVAVARSGECYDVSQRLAATG
ncbi:MAG: MBL fold metallo-hydrolase [Gaiellales bacterium]